MAARGTGAAERAGATGWVLSLRCRRCGRTGPHAAFAQALQELGWTVGRNVHIDIAGATAMPTLMRKYAAELVALAPEVILAVSATAAALQQATRTIPIVFAGRR